MALEVGSWMFNKDSVENWAYLSDFLTDAECDHIIEIAKRDKLKSSAIGDHKGSSVDSEYRNSLETFISVNKETQYLYSKLSGAVEYLNSKFFNFDLWGFAEPLQFTEYIAPNGKYDSHIDCLYDSRVRKLTAVVQLTDPSTYVGGDLEIIDSETPTKMIRTRGCLLAFPSYKLHRVTPVTEGTRNTLVGWVTGPCFK